jgi:VanZ family protein
MCADLKYRLLWQVVGYGLLATVIFLSVTSRPVDLGPDFAFKDKMYHVLAYFVLMTWFAQIYHRANARYVIAAILILMGVLLEFIQSYDPARYYEYGDMLANSAGVIFGFWVTMDAGKYLLARAEYIIHERIISK